MPFVWQPAQAQASPGLSRPKSVFTRRDLAILRACSPVRDLPADIRRRPRRTGCCSKGPANAITGTRGTRREEARARPTSGRATRFGILFFFLFGTPPSAFSTRDVYELVTLIRFAAAREHCVYIAYFIINRGLPLLNYRGRGMYFRLRYAGYKRRK